MRVLHVMIDEKFADSIILFYERFFDKQEHEICVLTNPERKSFYHRSNSLDIKVHEFSEEAVFSPAKALRWARWANQYDYIVMHSFCLRKYSLLFPKKKLVWIEWGYDLYDFKSGEQENLRGKARNWIRTALRKRAGTFVAIFHPDVDYYMKTFPGSHAHIYYAPYLGGNSDKGFYKGYQKKDRFSNNTREDNYIQIQIGHNGKEQLNHLETLKMLGHLKDCNIRILLSMSYGASEEYIEKVSEEAVRIFGEKAIVLKDYMPKEDYFALIDRTDVGVFNTARQTGLGNINRMLYYGTKVFMNRDGIMYDYFREKGFDIQDIASLPDLSFSQLCAPLRNDEQKVKAYFDDKTDFKSKLQMWKHIYDELKERLA